MISNISRNHDILKTFETSKQQDLQQNVKATRLFPWVWEKRNRIWCAEVSDIQRRSSGSKVVFYCRRTSDSSREQEVTSGAILPAVKVTTTTFIATINSARVFDPSFGLISRHIDFLPVEKEVAYQSCECRCIRKHWSLTFKRGAIKFFFSSSRGKYRLLMQFTAFNGF